MEKKTFAVAEVKAAESDNPNGEFEVILSAETLDRDGEVIDAKAFEPLPESIPFHAFHDFNDPIGRGVPFYDGDVLKARGTFASTPRAQEIRTLVSEGVIGHTSVGFMAATRKDADDAPHVTKGELLEGSFVSVPSNREAAVLMAKSFEAKAGARNSTKDTERLQTIHDLSVDNGATCEAVEKSASTVERKGHGMTANDQSAALDAAVRAAHGGEDHFAWVRDYADDFVIYELNTPDATATLRQAYTVEDGTVTLSGDPTPVVVRTSYEDAPKTATPAPETPSAEDGKSPASTVVEAMRLMARASLLSLD